MSESFRQMEEWFPDVNWWIGREYIGEYGVRDFTFLGKNMKNMKLCVGIYTCGSCSACDQGDDPFEREYIDYTEHDELSSLEWYLQDSLGVGNKKIIPILLKKFNEIIPDNFNSTHTTHNTLKYSVKNIIEKEQKRINGE